MARHVEPAGRLELVHERPWGSVWRAPVRSEVVWVKVCAPVQAFEPPLTTALASRWPTLLPTVLAVDAERAWLLLGHAGERLGFGAGPEPWLSILPAYGELQRGEVAHVAEHLDAGVPDRRLAGFPALYDAVLAHELPLSASDHARLSGFAPEFGRLCEELAAAGVAASIQHDDLHGNNVYSDDDTARILDWGDSCVSHPFLTLFVAFLHLEEMEGLAPRDPWFDRLRGAYLEPWGSELGGTLELAERLGPFAHVFKELRVLDGITEADRRFVSHLSGVLARCVAVAA